MKIFIRSQVIKELGSDFANYKETLEMFREDPSHNSLNLEKLHIKGAQPLYSIRDNQERRIILSLIKTKLGEQVWVVTKILTGHEYEELKKGGGAVGLSAEEKKEVEKACEVGSGKEEKSKLEIKVTTQIEYVSQQYILFDDEQESLKKASLPRVIKGAPGSGKTSTLLALIKHNMAHWVEQKPSGQLPRILVLAKSQYLIEQMRKEWHEMCQADASIKPEWIDCVEFQTPETIYKANHPGQAVTFLGEKEFTEWYLKYAKHYNSNLRKSQMPLPAAGANASLVYQELHTMSGYPNLAKYNKGVNDNLSLFPDPKAREAIWQVYQTYRTHIDNLNKLKNQQKVIDLSFQKIELTKQYDFIGIDEAQDLSRQQLRSLVQIDESKARKNLVLCVGDHQRLFGSESTIPYLKTLFWEGGEKKEVIENLTTTLHASYRCAESIVRFANASLYLKYQAIGGSAVTDNNELSFIQSVKQQKESSVDVRWLGGNDPKSEAEDSEKLEIVAKNNRANADFVVITSPKYFDDAVEKFGKERVFTAKQMKGLQAKEVLLYRFFEQDGFSEANKPISQEKEIDLGQVLKEGKIPKGCDTGSICHNNIFNELFVAITRAQTSLIIYQPLDSKKHRDIAAIGNPLQKLANESTADYTPSQEVKVSSEEDWRKRVEDLKERAKSDPDPKLREMILEIETRYLKTPSEMKQEVTESKTGITSFEEYLSRVNPKVADSKTSTEEPTKKTYKGKKQQTQKPVTQTSAKSQPPKPPVKKEIQEDFSQVMKKELASLGLEEQLNLILEYIIKGRVEAIEELLNFPFQELKDYQSLSKEEQIAQNLPAKVLVRYFNSKNIDGKALPEPCLQALVAYTKQISSWPKLQVNKERQDVFMAILYYRSNEWNLPLAASTNIIKAFAADQATFNFMKGYRQVRRNDFHSALARGDIQVVSKLQRLSLINTQDGEFGDGGTPLQVAAYNGRVALIESLLAAGADISYANERFGTALHMAVLGNKPDAIAKLIEKGAQVNQCIEGGETPLNFALLKYNKEAALALIEHGADVNQVNNDGETMLHYALKKGQIEVAIALIKKGADVNTFNEEGDTPLHIAARIGNIEVINALLEKNAVVNQPNNYNRRDTPLHDAVRKNQVEAIKILLSKGATLNELDFFKQTPLYIAVDRGFTDAANILIASEGINVNKICSELNESPLYAAVYMVNEKLVTALIDAKADINQANDVGETPLIVAAATGNVEIVSALIAIEECSFKPYKASIEKIEEMVKNYGDNSTKERAKRFIEKREADKDGELSILPHEIAAIFGHEEVKTLIYNKMIEQEIKNTHQYAFFSIGVEGSGDEPMEKGNEMSKR
ncbi:ankyrin repeat domain-containing protein [Legionella gresilensis]|uniref:ankyrin repeat domain-containing protein n=1 Tax=Legionella gresilensis TaxID=91823 RepID=UPI00104103F9|nr:ankyrin repeat domain-containing protein [Legionella gresilensis]